MPFLYGHAGPPVPGKFLTCLFYTDICDINIIMSYVLLIMSKCLLFIFLKLTQKIITNIIVKIEQRHGDTNGGTNGGTNGDTNGGTNDTNDTIVGPEKTW